MASIYDLRCARCGWTRTVQDGALMAGPETCASPAVCTGCRQVFDVPHREWRENEDAPCPSCQGPISRWGDPEGNPVGPCPRCDGEVEIDCVTMAD